MKTIDGRCTTARMLVAALAFGWVSCVAVHGAMAQAQSPEQQACINAVAGSAEKVGKQQAKESSACLKAAGKGTLAGAAQACLTADLAGKVRKQTSKVLAAESARCGSVPDFAYTSGAAASAGAQTGRLLSFGDVLGDLDASALACAASPAGCACQTTVAKSAEKLASTRSKLFLQCTKNALRNGASSAADIAKCVDDAGTADSLAADSKGKIAATVSKLASTIAGKCDAQEVTTAAFANGRCSSLTGSALATCIDERIACRTCQTINDGDGVDVDCDLFDDGAPNGSCDASLGCQNPSNTECTDGDACTVNDACGGGSCVGTPLAPDLRAAITVEKIVLDAQDTTHLQLELVTLTASPFAPTANTLSHPDGWVLEALSTTECSFEASPRAQYRCRHQASLLATTACDGDGLYQLGLTYSCSPDVSGCSLCSGGETVDFELDTSPFCG